MEPAKVETTNVVQFSGKNYVNYSETQAIYIQLSNLLATYPVRTVVRVLAYMIKSGSRYETQKRG